MRILWWINVRSSRELRPCDKRSLPRPRKTTDVEMAGYSSSMTQHLDMEVQDKDADQTVGDER